LKCLLDFLAYTANKTLRAEDLVLNEVTPSDWVYRSLNALNQFWQVGCFLSNFD